MSSFKSASTFERLFTRCAASHRLSAVVFSLVVLLALTVYYGRLIAGVTTFFISDHCYYFEPFTNFIGAALKEGRLPLWNPYLYCGMAQAAVPSPGIFYPPNLLFGYLAYGQALSLILLFSQLIACLGAFLLIGSFGWGVGAAAMGGITFGLCGYMFSLSTNYTLVAGAAWLPVMLWSFRRIKIDLEAGTKPYFASALSMLTTFMVIAAGRPEIFVPACLTNTLAIFIDEILRKRAGAAAINQLPWQLTAFSAAILLTMPIVLPVGEWVLQSPRAHGLNLSQTFMWSANWYDLVSMFFAYPFGDLQLLGAHHLPLVATRPVFLPYVPSSYIGPIVLTSSIWALGDKTWKWRGVLIAYFICVLILCLGEYTPITPALMQAAPALTMFRYPIKWMIYLILAFVLASTRGVYLLWRNEIPPGVRSTTWLIWLLALIVALFFLGMALARQELVYTKPPLAIEVELWLGQSILIGTTIGALTCGLEWCRAREKITPFATMLLIICGVSFNLFIPALKFQQITTSPKFWNGGSFMQDYLVDASKKQKENGRFLSLYFDPVWTPIYYRADFDKRWTTAFFDYARNLVLPNTNVDRKISETFGYEAAEIGSYRKMFFDILHQCSVCLPGPHSSDRKPDSQHYSDVPLFRLCQSTATSWIGTQAWKGGKPVAHLDERFFDLVKENHKFNVRLYLVKHQLPRAYLTQYWQWCNDEQSVVDKMSKADYSKFNPTAVTLVEFNATSGESDTKGRNRYLGPLIPVPPLKAPPLPPEVANSQIFDRDPIIDAEPVSVLVDEPEHISLSVNADRSCFLVLTDHFYPGWQGSIDGVKRSCFRVNGIGRGLYIPAGSHLIEFNYFPESLRIGFYLAIPGLLFLVFMFGCALRPYVWLFLKKLAGQQ